MNKKVLAVVIAIAVLALFGVGVYVVKQKKSNVPVTGNLAQPSTTTPVENLQETTFLHDQDRDGIPDVKEKELGTSDRDFDSDGDTLSDRMEIEVYKTDPTNPDTDGDGFWDGVEVVKGFNPNGTGKLTK